MTKEEIQKNSEHWYNKYKELEQKIEKLKADLNNAIESASKWYVADPVCSMLVDIYNDNFELKEIKENGN